MKTVPRPLVLTLSLCASACIAESELPDQLDDTPTSIEAEDEAQEVAREPVEPEDGPPLLDDGPADAIQIAKFQMSHGNVATMYALPDEGELLFSEISAVEENLIFADAQDVTMLERFLLLAPGDDVPIPRALLDTDEEGLVSPERPVVDVVDEPIEVDVLALGLIEPISRLDVGDACSDSGYFQNEVCYCSGCALPTAFWFCDANYNGGNSLWFDLTRTTETPAWGSPDKKSDSWSKTVACGTPVRTRHYRKALVGSTWTKSIDETRPDGTYAIWHAQGDERHRKVIHERTTSSGGLRAHSYFY
ncbi:MAG: hypothetical protein KDK70_24650 [Myxococcales bacterium]|nr:hypothetical protein [Myxococcales bacterium]